MLTSTGRRRPYRSWSRKIVLYRYLSSKYGHGPPTPASKELRVQWPAAYWEQQTNTNRPGGAFDELTSTNSHCFERCWLRSMDNATTAHGVCFLKYGPPLLPCPSYCYIRQLDPREIRETMRTQLGLPASFHLYLCPQAIFKFHPAFDDMLVSVFLAKETRLDGINHCRKTSRT